MSTESVTESVSESVSGRKFQLKPTIGVKIFAGLAMILFIFVVVGVLAYGSVSGLDRNADDVEHTHLVITEIDELLEHLVELEAAVNGFVATGDEVFLAEYDHNKERMEELYVLARELTIDSPDQTERFDGLRHELDQIEGRRTTASLRFDAGVRPHQPPRADSHEAEVVASDDSHGAEAAVEHSVGSSADAALAILALDEGLTIDLMGQIRTEHDLIAGEELERLEGRLEAQHDSVASTHNIIVIGVIIAVLSAGAVAYFLTRSISKPLRATAKGRADLRRVP